jgi:putative Ca2+/H+ antiporter (TMEM165/GDT1 family)
VGITVATALINAISVAVGYGLGLALPTHWISVAAGLVFIGFAIWTLLATVTLASQNGWAGTWLGSTLGMVAATAIAIVVGRQLGKRLPERVVRLAAAALFAVVGIWLLVDALT